MYVYKLFPKNQYHCEDEETLQRAMHGTVSSYKLNQDHMVAMVQGNLMPQKPAVLASMLTITFIGTGPLPKKLLKKLFEVRRKRVAPVLVWLKANNPKYYGNIDISMDRLTVLPEDDVPDKVVALVQRCSDVGMALQEGAGYVPENEAPSGDASSGMPEAAEQEHEGQHL